MREILFRGKTEEGEWIEGDLFHRNEEVLINNFHKRFNINAIPETIGQYTGLTDKNGTKIFEGDIVKDHDYFGVKCVVTFCQGTFDSGIYKYNGWVLQRADGDVDHCELVIYDEDNNFEVIGNIHDNPELLKGGVQE
jgi:uncharacterized phage protein (TIGR01671 family)